MTSERVMEMLAAHRVNYHQRNVGPEPVTAENLRYTSCEGCGWLGGHHDEAGWEAHLAEALAPLLAEVRAEALREAAEALFEGPPPGMTARELLLDLADREQVSGERREGGEG